MGTHLTFPDTREVGFVDRQETPLTATKEGVHTLFSGIPSTTELSSYRSISPHQMNQWDADTRRFVAGDDAYAVPVDAIGYEEVGMVVELGSDVSGLKLGGRVWGSWGQCTTATLEADYALARRVHPDADPRIGIFAYIGVGLAGGRGVDVPIEFTGNYRAPETPMRSVAYSSRVCVVGFFTGDASGIALGEEFHHNRLQLISSQICCSAPHFQHRWDRFRLNSTKISLATEGRLDPISLIWNTRPFGDAAEAYRLLDASPVEAMHVVLEAPTVDA